MAKIALDGKTRLSTTISLNHTIQQPLRWMRIEFWTIRDCFSHYKTSESSPFFVITSRKISRKQEIKMFGYQWPLSSCICGQKGWHCQCSTPLHSFCRPCIDLYWHGVDFLREKSTFAQILSQGNCTDITNESIRLRYPLAIICYHFYKESRWLDPSKMNLKFFSRIKKMRMSGFHLFSTSTITNNSIEVYYQ